MLVMNILYINKSNIYVYHFILFQSTYNKIDSDWEVGTSKIHINNDIIINIYNEWLPSQHRLNMEAKLIWSFWVKSYLQYKKPFMHCQGSTVSKNAKINKDISNWTPSVFPKIPRCCAKSAILLPIHQHFRDFSAWQLTLMLAVSSSPFSKWPDSPWLPDSLNI